MPKPVAELLHRRTDLSTFLVHLTKEFGGVTARDNLLSILATQIIEARSVLGMGKPLVEVDENLAATQKVVCFTETPLEHTWMMCESIEHRAVSLAPYGLAFTKTWARRQGVNPVWYIDITAGHDWLTNPINELIQLAVHGHAARWNPATQAAEPLAASESQAARIAPFIEQMGNPAGTRKEFWWEREWRYVGDLFFQWFDVVAVLVPEADRETFLVDLEAKKTGLGHAAPVEVLSLLDPRWGLERMIASLAGVDAANVGPFPE